MSQPDPREVARLLGEGKTLTEIAAQLEGPSDGPTDAELAHASASAASRTGGAPPGYEPPVDAPLAMLDTYRQARAGGARTEVAQRAALQVLIEQAHAGNPTALYVDQHTHAMQQARRQGPIVERMLADRYAREAASAEARAATAATFLAGRPQ